jgi:hypothetical protein
MKAAAVLAAFVLLGTLAACGGSPPQITSYSPERAATDVSTAAPIQITFDHNVDKQSVESRLALTPATPGTVVWLGPRQLQFNHTTLQANTTYEVVLQAGYKDLAGNSYALRHHWTFTTEVPPSVAGSTPSNSQTEVDPSSYLSIDFTREMDATSLAGAITMVPSLPFSVRLDPSDAKRAVISPDSLLAPSTTYTVDISTGALDAHGNQLDRNQTFVFHTGAARPLRHWVAFTAALADGSSGGVWIVNETGFPRQLFEVQSVQSFSWSPDGTTMLIQTGDGLSWSAFTPGASALPLPFKATWAAALSAGLGYVYLDAGGTLHRWSADGADEVIATNVLQAATAPGGQRVAFVRFDGKTSTLWGYDVGLRSRYELTSEPAAVSDLSWSPAGNRIAYLRNDARAVTLRVRSLVGQAATTTVASGDIGHPTWLPDSTDLVFAAGIATAGGTVQKAFLVSVIAPPAALTAALAIPSGTFNVASPVPSPDGHQIAFVSQDQVWIMNADGTRPTPLTKFDPASFPYLCRTPAWTRA